MYDKDIIDATDFAAAHGFGFIVPDLMIPRFWPERFSLEERRKIRRHLVDRGVSISFHAPSDNIHLGVAYPEVREAIHIRMKLCLDLCQDLEAERFTVHPTQPNNFSSNGKTGEYLKSEEAMYRAALKESLRYLSDHSSSVEVCVENEPLTPFIENVLGECFDEELRLFLTLDAPKALDGSRGDPKLVAAFYDKYKTRIREIHLHDRRPGGHYHDVLGGGQVDLSKVLETYASLPVAFNLEIRPREAAARCLSQVREEWGRLGSN